MALIVSQVTTLLVFSVASARMVAWSRSGPPDAFSSSLPRDLQKPFFDPLLFTDRMINQLLPAAQSCEHQGR